MRSFACSCLVLLVCACGDNKTTGDASGDQDPYDTFQACFDDHHKVENFNVPDAIAVCCLDHPIGGQPENVVCGGTQSACETFVMGHLAGSDATAGDITTGCTKYLNERSM